MGAAILAVILAQIITATGWGEYFPWSVPAYARLGIVSYVIVLLAGLLGMVGTFVWWAWADQTD